MQHVLSANAGTTQLGSVAMAIADVFQKNAISMGRKFAEMQKIFDKIDGIESQRALK